MQFVKLLVPEAVIIPLSASNKDDALRVLVERYVNVYKVSDVPTLYNELKLREDLGTTFLPNGLAVPHARSDKVDKINIVMGISPNGIVDMKDQGGQVGRVFCLFFTPMKENSFGDHLNLLSRISSIFSESGFVSEICKLNSTDSLIKKLDAREKEIEE